MRVAIATDWFAPRRGGIESQLAQLASGLAARGHEVTVLTTSPGPAELARTGVNVRRIGVATLPGTGVAISPSLPRVLRQAIAGADVVHAHVSVVSPTGYAAALAARREGLPVVVTFHSVLQAKRALLAVMNALFGFDRGATRWTAVSRLVAGQVQSALPGARVGVLPNGIDLPFWTAANGARASGAVTLVSAMRLHRKKRPRILLRSFARAVGRSGTARLRFLGEGPELASLRREAARLGILPQVDFAGWMERVALRDAITAADAFVLPSRHESFGLAALEARAAGLPVIAMRSAGCREFLSDGIDAVLCDDDGALAEGIARLIADADWRHRLASARPDLGAYDWPAVLARHERVYADAIMAARAAG